MRIDFKPSATKYIWASLVGCSLLASYSMIQEVSRFNEKNSQAKDYIQNHDINRYQELLKQDGYPKTFDWTEEAKKVENAVKMDSVAKTNYALGMQAVRDSIANANKVNKEN